MPRLLHLADVHLGARHPDLGTSASRLRERQAAAFRRAVDVGIEAHVDVALVAGDLFDSNAQPRRVVEAAALELRRLTEHGIRVVLIPGSMTRGRAAPSTGCSTCG
ncbi:MAG: metallophosphoesterase [Chloroflexota bacterium]